MQTVLNRNSWIQIFGTKYLSYRYVIRAIANNSRLIFNLQIVILGTFCHVCATKVNWFILNKEKIFLKLLGASY